jgi:hypothetical protein
MPRLSLYDQIRKFILGEKTFLGYDPKNIRNKERFKLRKAGSSDSARKLKAIYRISDGSREKERFQFAGKELCLRNFLDVFQISAGDLLIIADNVTDETWRMVGRLHSNTTRTNICQGAGSWRHAAFDMVLKDYHDDDVVYFVEDDYLHLPGSKELLLEGIAIADYVSLYDHCDKYLNHEDGGFNPFIEYGGEITRVILTPGSHWKLTNSTTMTFATTVGVLREDQDVWDRFTRFNPPKDFHAFVELAGRGRSLITPIPGYSTHCEPVWAAPGVDWEKLARAYASSTIVRD